MILSDYRVRRLSLVALCLLLDASAARVTLSDGLNGVAVETGVEGSPQPAIDAAKAKRLEWFREAKYGLFIHWGLYAAPAGQWKGQRIPGIGEWIMNRAQIPVKEYEQLARTFNPVKFNADEWVQLAKDAGMKYIVITAKHHDGFALFDSKVSTYDIVDATPFKRDVAEGAGRGVREAGIRLGFYYSQAQDWHEPERRRQHLGLRPRRAERLRRVSAGQGGAANQGAAHRLWAHRPHLVRHAAHDDGRASAPLHAHRAIDAARHPD